MIGIIIVAHTFLLIPTSSYSLSSKYLSTVTRLYIYIYIYIFTPTILFLLYNSDHLILFGQLLSLSFMKMSAGLASGDAN